MKNISRNYDKLRCTQRIALAIEAMARGDMQEMDRLDSTCPRRSYYGIDQMYVRGLGELHTLALLYETEVLSRLVRVVAIQGVLIHLHNAEGIEDDDRIDSYMDRGHILRAEIQGWHNAWSEFCSSNGMAATAVLRAFDITLPAQALGADGASDGLYGQVENQTRLAAVAAMAEVLNPIVKT